MILRPKSRAEEIALFRSEIVGALVRRDLSRGELKRELEALSLVRFRVPGSACTRSYSVPTLQRWYYAYRTGGLSALHPQPRHDRGHGRALSGEARTLLCQIRRENPCASATLIVRTLVADGRMSRDEVSLATVRRLYQEHGLDRATPQDGHTTVRLRWQVERPNALWHGDVCHGAPLVLPNGTTQPLRIHALLDDATRYVLAIEALHSEREADMLALLVRALRRHGPPQALYLDNGPTYRGNDLRLACERLGTTLIHAKPYDAPARGKMERFWRTLREGCLDQLGAMSSLHEVNVRLYAFLDQHYHRAPHAGLLGRAPGQVWRERAAERPADAMTMPPCAQRSPSTNAAACARTPRSTSMAIPGSSPPASSPDTWSTCIARSPIPTPRPGSSTRASACRSIPSIPRAMRAASAPAAPRRRPRPRPSTHPAPCSTARSDASPGMPRRTHDARLSTHLRLSLVPFSKEVPEDELWLPPSKQSTVDDIIEALHERASITLSGEPGVGKTSVLRAIKHQLAQGPFRLTYCHNATLGRRDFYRQLCLALGLMPAATAAGVFHAVSTHVDELSAARVHPVFLLDEAHLLHQDTLDHLHILLNYEWDSKALLSLVLVGLSELDDRLALRRNRSLLSRLHHRFPIGPLTPDDTADYVRARLARAGCTRELFPPDSLAMLHEATRGAMRDIDRIASAALRQAARLKRRSVERDVLARVLDAEGRES